MYEKPENIVRTSIRMDARLHERASDMVHAMKKRRQKVSMDWLVQNAVHLFLEQNPDPATAKIQPPRFEDDPRLAHWIQMVRDILHSNHQVAIDAITRTLLAFQELTAAPRKRGKPAIIMPPDDLIRGNEQLLQQYRNTHADQQAG